jgi:hypothetical protein
MIGKENHRRAAELAMDLTHGAVQDRLGVTLIMGQFGSEQARRVIQGSGMSGAP